MPYEVFESLEWAGRPLPVEEIAEARVLGRCESWRAALRVVARIEVEARRQPRGGGGFAVGIRLVPPARVSEWVGKGASEASGCER